MASDDWKRVDTEATLEMVLIGAQQVGAGRVVVGSRYKIVHSYAVSAAATFRLPAMRK